jgi:squalene-associated FAD-dependent desaturase
MEDMDHRVAVVGAGYAGMAAAVALAQKGVPVTVFESGPLPGGRARRVVSQGIELDNGQHILIGAYKELLALMRLVGVPEDATMRLPLDLRYFDGFRFRAPFAGRAGLLAAVLAARLPFAEKIHSVVFLRTLQAKRFQLDEDVTVEDLLETHRQQGRIGHYLWRPLCVSALNTPADQASAQAFLVVLRDALFGGAGASDLVLPRVDLSRLFPEPAAAYVRARGGEVRCGSTVRDLDALKREFTRVIVAVGPHQLKALVPAGAPDYSYQPIYTCYLQYPDATRLPFPMLGLADGLVQWVFDRGALTGEHGRLACVISAQGDHQQLELDALADACHRELARAIPGLGAPLWSRVIAEKRATIACTPGVGNMTVGIPGVTLAGDYADREYPPTLEAAVRSGLRAATSVVAALQKKAESFAAAP